MITILSILLVGGISFLATEFLPLPWYTPMIIAFIFGLLTAKLKVYPFLMGALGVGLFWVARLIPGYLANDGILTQKMAELFTGVLGFTITPFLLIIFTFFIGALLGGLAAFSGHLLLAPAAIRPNLLRRGRNSKRSGTYKLRLE